MYAVSPHYGSNFEVEKPACMYEMKKIYNELPKVNECATNKQQSCHAMSESEKYHALELDKRQTSLISQLNDLTNLLRNIKAKLLAGPPNSVGNVVHPLKTGSSLDVVIYAPPTYNFLALITLSNWLKEIYSVKLIVYLHSSLKKDENRLSKLPVNQTSAPRTSTQLILTVILKEGIEVPQFQVSPKQRVPVVGEPSLIRFLSTLIWPRNTFEDPIKLCQVDEWLDLAHLLHLGLISNKEIMDNLSTHLAKNKFLVGDVFSVADLGFLSFISQKNLASKLPENVKRWKENCRLDAAVKAAWDLVC